MADREQLGRALQGAHKAGDMDAARKLAQAILALDAAPQENVIATTPDGGRFIRQDSGATVFASPGYSTSDPEIVKRLMGGDSVKRVVQSGFDKDVIAQHPIAARVQEFNRGAPFIGSYLDEAVGMVSPKARDAMRTTSDAMRREKPGQTMGLNVGGALGYGIPMAMGAMAATPSALASKATGLLGGTRVGQAVSSGILGMLGGGTEGAIYGGGEGTTPDERIDSAAEQGAIGAAFGGALGLVAPSVGEVFKAISNRFRKSDTATIAKELGVSKDGAIVLKRAFEQNDEVAFERIMRAGDEATLADAGRSGAALLDAAAQTGGRPLNIVDSAVTARNKRSAGLLSGALDDTMQPPKAADTALQVMDGAAQADVERRANLLAFDGPVGPREMAADIARRSAPARKAVYGEAYRTPIDYTTGNPAGARVLEVVDALPPNIRAQAASAMDGLTRLEGLRGNPIPEAALLNEAGERVGSMPTIAQLDYLKRALDQIAEKEVDQFGRLTPDGRVASGFAAEVRRAAIAASGGGDGTYARALKIGGDKIELDQALDLGLEMMRDSKNTTTEVVRERLSEMSPDARQMVRAGLRSYIDDLMGKVKVVASDPDGQDARQALAALKAMSSDNARSKLRLLMGEDYAKLAPALDQALASQSMKADVARNSATAVRRSIQGTVDDMTKPGLLGQIARGEPVDATKRLTQELLDTTPGADAARKEQIWSEIASALSQKRGNRSTAAALKYIQAAIDGQPLKEAEARLIAQQTVLALPVLGGRAGNLGLQQPRIGPPTR